jgi:hypothetical protein
MLPSLEMMTIYYSIAQFATTHHQVQLNIFLLPHFAYMSTKLLPRKAFKFFIFQKNPYFKPIFNYTRKGF